MPHLPVKPTYRLLLLNSGLTVALWAALSAGSPGWGNGLAGVSLCAAAGFLASAAGLAYLQGRVLGGENAQKTKGECVELFWKDREKAEEKGTAKWNERVKPAAAAEEAEQEPAGGAFAAEGVAEEWPGVRRKAGDPGLEVPGEERVPSGKVVKMPVKEEAVPLGEDKPPVQAAAAGVAPRPANIRPWEFLEALKSFLESLQLEDRETWSAVERLGSAAAEKAAELESSLGAALESCRGLRSVLEELAGRVKDRA